MELLITLLIGTLIGTITGIIPGIHANLAASAIAAYIALYNNLKNENIIILMLSMGVAHSIADNLPATFLGMPNAEKIMSALPAHRLLFKGNGLESITLSVTGALLGTAFSIALFPLIYAMFSFGYEPIRFLIGPILLVILTILVMNEKNKFHALGILLLTGLFGIAVFRLDLKEPLLPMLSGLFGISTLLSGCREKMQIPKQKNNLLQIERDDWLKPTIISVIMGIFSAFLPGIGPSQVAALGSKMMKNITEKGFIVLSCALSTINLVAGTVAFYAIGKSRNGIVASIQGLVENISGYEVLLMEAAMLAAAGIAAIITIIMAKNLLKVIPRINYFKLSICVIIFNLIIVLFISGPRGLLILLTATSIGLMTISKNISKQHMMGCILLPVILFFLGISINF